MSCRIGCGACCIAISISSPIPGMPHGKPAGERCIQLDEQNKCKLFGHQTRPKVCHDFKFDPIVCGNKDEDAFKNLKKLEENTI